jgi:hypothetical protein
MRADPPAGSSLGDPEPARGRQLTVLIVSLMIGIVLVPSTVWAVDTFSNVAIEDPSTGAKASVDTRQHLAVVAESPTTPLVFSEDDGAFTLKPVVGPTKRTINLTALSASPKDGQTGSRNFFLYVESVPSSAPNCGANSTYTLYHVPAMQTSPVFVATFPTPLVIRPAAGKRSAWTRTFEIPTDGR